MAFSQRCREQSAAKPPPTNEPTDTSSLGPLLGKVIAASSKGKAIDDLAVVEQKVLAFLHSLHEAYSDCAFQTEIAEIERKAGGDALKHISGLGPAAARVQAPVFERFGLPKGQRGVLFMKAGVKILARGNPEIHGLAGDLRELLGLHREEEDTVALLNKADANMADLVSKLAKAPVDVRGPVAEVLKLPYKASPEEIAREVPNIRKRATEIAEKHLERDRAELIGPGKLLAQEDIGSASDAEIRTKLIELFEHYIQKMLARAVTTVDSFTKPPADFCCSWADALILPQHAQELWGERLSPELSKISGVVGGASVIESALEEPLAAAARKELQDLEARGELAASQDPCNRGARSLWLHFETAEERQQLPKALGEICLRLAGLPAALEAAAAESGLPKPGLRIHPHVMAATYRKGSEYHVHKDSYGGADNQRSLSVLLYLSDAWHEGDKGELRLYAQGANGSLDESQFQDLAPLCGRLVLFRSREVWHAVREPREQRWALTLWVMAE